MKTLPTVHFADAYLLNPTNPIMVNLIGAGGNGSEMLRELAKMNYSMTALGHPGIHVTLYDDDKVSPFNRGRQEFAETEIGLYKSVVLINRANRFYGTNWKAVNSQFRSDNYKRFTNRGMANIFISCTDSASSRFDIAEALKQIRIASKWERNKALYWMDLGNSRFTGQVILSTLCEIEQPSSEKYRPIAMLPIITEEFEELLKAQDDTNEPSCSTAEALEKQDLYINPVVVNFACTLLWQFLRNGLTENRGVFVNLETFQTQPIKITG